VNERYPARIQEAILVDEIGIEIGVYRDYRLKTAYQPIFRRTGGLLTPVAVEALVAPHRKGLPVTTGELFDDIPPEDALFVESLCRALHLHNHPNIGVPSLELYFNFDPRANADLDRTLAELRHMAGWLGTSGLDPRLLVCELSGAAELDDHTLTALTDVMRGLGIRIAVDDFGTGHSTYERIARYRPDVVKIEGTLYRAVCSERSAARLLAPLVGAIRLSGAEVLIEGIETPAQLAIAAEVGADLVQGFLLGKPALAGTIFDETPQALGRLLAEGDDNVIRLFG
jgi:EAL domain-containing protein (putative c-di-GMP-specific phosphodiesterase class I)